MRVRIVLLALLLVTPAANSAELTGHDVMRMCRAAQDGCYLYLSAVRDAYHAMHARSEIPPTICMRDNVTPAQLSEAFQAYLDDRLQHWHFEAAGLALNAFQKRWPCAR